MIGRLARLSPAVAPVVRPQDEARLRFPVRMESVAPSRLGWPATLQRLTRRRPPSRETTPASRTRSSRSRSLGALGPRRLYVLPVEPRVDDSLQRRCRSVGAAPALRQRLKHGAGLGPRTSFGVTGGIVDAPTVEAGVESRPPLPDGTHVSRGIRRRPDRHRVQFPGGANVSSVQPPTRSALASRGRRRVATLAWCTLAGSGMHGPWAAEELVRDGPAVFALLRPLHGRSALGVAARLASARWTRRSMFALLVRGTLLS